MYTITYILRLGLVDDGDNEANYMELLERHIYPVKKALHHHRINN